MSYIDKENNKAQESAGCTATAGSIFTLVLFVTIIIICIDSCKIFQAEMQLSNLRTSKEELLKEKSSFLNEISKIKKERTNLEQKIKSLNNEKAIRKTKITELQKQLNSLSSERKKLQIECQNYKEKFEILHKNFNERKQLKSILEKNENTPHFVNIKVNNITDKLVRIYGDSNFPSNTKFELIIKETTGICPFMQKTTFRLLESQLWSSDFVLEGEKGIPPGIYSVIVKTTSPTEQPPEVKRELGLFGENIKGSSITIKGKYYYYQNSITLSIGKDAENQQRKRHAYQAKTYNILRIKMCKQFNELLFFKSSYCFRNSNYKYNNHKSWLEKTKKLESEIKSYPFLPKNFRSIATLILFLADSIAKNNYSYETEETLIEKISNTLRYKDFIRKHPELDKEKNKRKFTEFDYYNIKRNMTYSDIMHNLENVEDVIILPIKTKNKTTIAIHSYDFVAMLFLTDGHLDKKITIKNKMTREEFHARAMWLESIP